MTNVFISIKDGEKLDELRAEFGLKKWELKVVTSYEVWSGGPLLTYLPDNKLPVSLGKEGLEIMNWE